MPTNTTALIEIIGVNGEHWTVSGDGMGEQGVELADDPEGLFDEAPFTSIWQQGADQEGATYLATRVEPMDLTLVFDIFGDLATGQSWEDVEGRFFASFAADRPATIQITTEEGRRSLRVVKLEKSKQLSVKDPRITGYSQMMLVLRAPWPFWEGETFYSTWTAPTASASGSITVFNPTDRPLWLHWAATARGRWTIPDYNFNGGEWATRKVTTPLLTTGQDLTIDTYPRNERYVAADGHNIAGRFAGVDFLHPIPPGTPRTTLPVSVASGVAGVSTIACRMVQQWQRAAGRGR